MDKNIPAKKWDKLSFVQQMANIGSEAERAMSWKKQERQQYFWNSLCRTLDLINLTIGDEKNINQLRELTRIKELWLDLVVGKNEYRQSDETWKKYFHPFYIKARKKLSRYVD